MMADHQDASQGPMSVDQASTETIANCHRFWSVIKSNDMMDDVLKEIKNKISILQRQSQFELRSEGSHFDLFTVQIRNIGLQYSGLLTFLATIV